MLLITLKMVLKGKKKKQWRKTVIKNEFLFFEDGREKPRGKRENEYQTELDIWWTVKIIEIEENKKK